MTDRPDSEARSQTARAGVALLDAVCALAIAGSVGIGMQVLTLQSAASSRQVAESEQHLADADAFLHAVVLWPRDDLERRLGARRQGEWILEVESASSETFIVRLRRPDGGEAILWTAVHRPRGTAP